MIKKPFKITLYLQFTSVTRAEFIVNNTKNSSFFFFSLISESRKSEFKYVSVETWKGAAKLGNFRDWLNFPARLLRALVVSNILIFSLQL